MFAEEARRFSKTSVMYFAVIFCISLTMAFFIPVSSLFLTEELGVSGFETGLFFTVSGILSIAVSQLVARYSDMAGNRRNIILFGCVCGMVSCICFALIRSYLFLLLAVNFIHCFSHVGGQVFASGREYSRYTGRNSLIFTSVMRAFFAFAWVFGPPAAMVILENFGFSAVYLSCAAVFLVSFSAVGFMMPATDFAEDHDGARSARLFSEPSVYILFAVTVLIFACNNMYLITMPQYVTRELHFEHHYAGVFMATAAALEIPCMLISGRLAQKIHMKYILIVATVSGFLYYIAVSFASTLVQFWTAQLANAVCIGIVTSLMMVYFQEMLPKIPGQATTLFSSAASVGGIISGAVCGLISDAWGFVSVFNFAVGLSFLAFVLMCLVRKI
jgi:SET family sugar efflux transporter-like MFS transporter